jgi:hypothetical protein
MEFGKCRLVSFLIRGKLGKHCVIAPLDDCVESEGIIANLVFAWQERLRLLVV